MPEAFTRVGIVFRPEYLNHWLRFGAPDALVDLDRRRAFAYFAPGRVFGYMRWEAGEYGTRLWRLQVVRSGNPGDRLERIAGIRPGGELLLDVAGNAAVKRALAFIDDIEARGIDPAAVSPAYFRHAHNRIATRLTPRAYTVEQHRAHLAMGALAP